MAETLFPRPVMPNEADLTRYSVRQSDIVEGWRRAGVLTSLASLERDEIYAKLLELPQRSPDGRLARPLYQWLLNASDLAIGDTGANHKEFLVNGRMWGRFGDTAGYFSIQELHHADADGLPDVLLKRLKMADLRKRVGADKVERLFGVKSVDRTGIRQTVMSYQLAVGSTAAEAHFQTAKPFLHKLRTSQTTQLTNLQALKALRLLVCSELRAEIAYERETFEYDVPVWGWLIQDLTLYVRGDPANSLSQSADLLADAIGEALASIFRVGDGGEYARMILCQRENRVQLLRKMRGEAVGDGIEALVAEFDAFGTNYDNLGPVGYTVSEAPRPPSNTLPPSAPFSPAPSSDELETTRETQEPKSFVSLQVAEKVQFVAPPPSRQPLRVQVTSRKSHGTTTTHRVVDGDFCKRKAIEFEEATDPPRFPLLVSHIVGFDGPLCDIVSFSTEANRTAFRFGPTRDLTLVARFIEVKGRSNEVATIELKGNELTAAEGYRARYYLYRLFEFDDGNFELAVLQNPLDHKDALQPAVHVSLDRAVATLRFLLTDGIQKDQNI